MDVDSCLKIFAHFQCFLIYSVFENYDKLMTAFRQRHVSGIVIDRYAVGVHLLNEKDAFRHQIFQSKHFSLSMKYAITANMSQSKYEEMMNDGCYSYILDLIEEVTSKHLGQKEIQVCLCWGHERNMAETETSKELGRVLNFNLVRKLILSSEKASQN